jgi:HME family heavy-metal exporter
MIGGIAALALTHTPLSVASLIGFVALAGIAARNGILKLSRYLQLARQGEPFGEALILRGSGERLTPVLMTALIAAAALLPLLGAADAPGKEILHPVALVIFGGLISSTLLDSFITPLLFSLFGATPLRRLALDATAGEDFERD